MPRWVWWTPLVALTAVLALLAFRLGWIDAHLTESAAIEAYAARHMRETGAPEAHCTAMPGETVWLVIRCRHAGAVWEYRVNRFGGLVGETGPASDDRMPGDAREPST